MAKRLSIMLVALLGFAFAVAGCGDDEEETNNAKDTAPPATAPAATAPRTTEEQGGGSAASGVPASPQAKQAVEDCKKQASANPQMSSEAKSKIREVCEEAGSGDTDGAIKATREACVIIVEDTTPAGAGRRKAVAACKQSTRTP